MFEDDNYISSTQYRCWSFPKERLEETRRETNALAAEKLRAAFARARSTQPSSINDNASNSANDADIQTLSVEEELRIVEWGSDKIIQMGESMEPRIPANVIATAIQYLRRFYLTNSPMTYHPRQITACALFLATKADHCHISLHRFIANLEKVSEEDVKAPEFLLMQGLRFTLDVRHPMRGLEGGVAEIQALANEGRLGTLQRRLNDRPQTPAQRIGIAADGAKKLLRTAAQMTDAYFLYTPSQIWLAAMHATDQDLTRRFVDHVCSRLGPAGSAMKTRLWATLESCSLLLSSYTSAEDDSAKAKEIRKVGKKLNTFQNPEKLDMIALARGKAAEKREGANKNPDKALKKRKLEREKLEKDGDVFGPALGTKS